MRYFRKLSMSLSALYLVLSPISARALELSFANPARDTNELRQRLAVDGDGRGRFNKQDCSEKDTIRFHFKVSITQEEMQGNVDVLLLAGAGCEDDASRCTSFAQTIAAKNRPVSYTISELFGPDFTCTGTGEISVWLVRDTDWEGHWLNWDQKTDPLVIAYDLDNPDPPTLETAVAGDQKVGVTWSGTSGGDSIYILHYPGSSTGSDQSTDDTGADTTPDDAGASTDDTGTYANDAGDVSDAGVSPKRMVWTPSFATADATKDTESAACPSPDGGFSEGDSYDASSGSKDYGLDTANKGGSAEVEDLVNKQPYKFGLVTRDSFNNFSKVSNTLCATPGDTRNFFEDYTDAGGKGGKFCFIATAAFGSYNHPMVRLLRMFRDRFLAALPGGNRVIAFYYRVGPDAARVVAAHPMLRWVTAGVLSTIALLSVPLSWLGPFSTLSLTLLIFGAALLRRRIRRRSADLLH